MVTRERMGSPEAVVINFASITYHVQKVLPINCSYSEPFCLVKQREVAVRDKANGCMEDQFPTGSAGYCVVTKGASTEKAREALRDKTKNCCTGLTCRHNNTKY